MAVLKVKLAGRDVTFQSEDDFARALAALERVDDAPERSAKNSRPAKAYNALQATASFLEEIISHGPDGVHSSIIAAALKCEPRGIGRRLLEIDAVLKPLGFKRDSVYDNSKRVAEGGRIYAPGPQLPAALDAVKRKAGSG